MRISLSNIRFATLWALAAFSVAAAAEAPFAFGTKPGKLPKDLIPQGYTVNLVPNLAPKTFRGSENVRIKVLRPTATLVLNQINLKVDSASLSGKGITDLKLTARLDNELQTSTVYG